MPYNDLVKDLPKWLHCFKFFSHTLPSYRYNYLPLVVATGVHSRFRRLLIHQGAVPKANGTPTFLVEICGTPMLFVEIWTGQPNRGLPAQCNPLPGVILIHIEDRKSTRLNSSH